MPEIELLYFDGCPSWQTALENLRVVIEAEKLPHQVRLVEIITPQQAQAERFLGSPRFAWMELTCGLKYTAGTR